MSLFEQLSEITGPGRILANEPMKNHTTFAIGGPAEFLVLAENERHLLNTLRLCERLNIPCLVIGRGSNLLVSDNGIAGVVLKIAKDFARIYETFAAPGFVELEAESGAKLSAVADFAQKRGLAGLEFASGIPGTIGGAIFMNAGAYGREMKDVVTRVRLAKCGGIVKDVAAEDMSFGYRSSAIQKDGSVVLNVRLRLAKGKPDDILAAMRELNAMRAEKQPLNMPSAGSTFKRPEGHFAGKLIMDCGLSGFSIGGAQVSEKHCGFIVNKGGATAGDVLALIAHVKDMVYRQFGVLLTEEIRFVGKTQE